MSSNRLLHAMLKVSNLNASIEFYESCGMRALSFVERPNGAATSFVGYGAKGDMEHFALELSQGPRKGRTAVAVGSGLQFLGLAGVPDRTDPDGYRVKAVGTEIVEGPFCCLCLRVADLEGSVAFYGGPLGMVEQPAPASWPCGCRLLRYPSPPAVALALVQDAAQGPVDTGSGYDHLAVSTPDVHVAAAALRAAGVELTVPPMVMFGMNITGFKDPDGYSVYLVEEAGFRSG